MAKSGGFLYLLGVAWFTASLIIGVTNDVVTKFLEKEYAVAQVVCLRYAFATLSLAIVFFWQRKISPSAFFRISKLHLVRAVLLLLGIGLYCHGLQKLPIATVVALNFAIPIFTMIFARIFLGEKVCLKNVVATVCGFVGIFVILGTRLELMEPAAALLLLSSVMFASLDTINKRFVTGEGVFAMVFYTAYVTFLLSVPFACARWTWPSWTDICLFAVLGIGANLLLYCILKSFELVKISAIAPLRYLEFILTAMAGFLVFGEIPTWKTVIGSLIIISSTIYIAMNNVVDG
jgi:drug/metabolite transporter (DMT)-like permease